MSPSFSRLWLLVALGGCLLGASAEAKTLEFPQQDVAFEVPEEWLASTPPAGAIVVVHNSIAKKIGGDTSAGSKAVVLLVAPIPAGVPINPSEFISRMRKTVQEQGGVVVATGKRSPGSLTFETTTIAQGAMDRPLSYMCTTFGNDRAVTLMLSSREVDPSNDAELDTILRSLRFLSPYRPITELTFAKRAVGYAGRHWLALTALALVGVAAIVVLVIIVRQYHAKTVPPRTSRKP